MKPLPEDLAAAIRQARRQQDLSQAHLAEKAGLSRPTVARLEAGQPISSTNLLALTRALGLELKLE